MKKLLIALSAILLITASCNTKPEKQEEKVVSTEENDEISELSIYNLPTQWTTQEGKDIELVDLKGDVLVMVMIYTTCKAACPRLVADMRNIESRVPKNTKNKVRYVLVSIDPTVDTPETLKAFSIENQMAGDQWLFLRSTEDNTREFAAVLAVNYKKISPIDFSHSNIISVFNTKGELAFQQEGLGVSYDKTVEEITAEANK
jgi:protein SCO1/2